MSEIKLKPCPFCGKPPVFTADCDVTDGYNHSFAISCFECGFSISDEYQIGVAERWNRRALSDQRSNGDNARLIAAAPVLLEALRQMVVNSEADKKEYRDCHKKAVAAIATLRALQAKTGDRT